MTNISLDDSGQTALCYALNGGVVKNSRFQVLCRSQPEKKYQHNRSIKKNRFWKLFKLIIAIITHLHKNPYNYFHKIVWQKYNLYNY